MKTADRERLGKEAGVIARADTLKHCKAANLTPSRFLKRISEALDATESKVFYDKDRGKCITGPAQVDHARRLEAAKIGITLHDMEPVKTKRIEFDETTLNAILQGLPAGIGGLVRAALLEAVSDNKG